MHCTSSRSIILWAPKLFFASAASVLECIDICARHRVSICICSELPLESFHSICHWLGMLRHTNADTSHPAAHTHPDLNYKCKTHYYEVFLFRFRENKLHVTSVEKYCRNVVRNTAEMLHRFFQLAGLAWPPSARRLYLFSQFPTVVFFK